MWTQKVQYAPVSEAEPGAVQAYGHVGERGQQVGLVQGVALLDAQDPQGSPVVVAGEPELADLPEGYEREDLGAGLARGRALGRLHGRGGQRDRGDALHVGDGADEQFDRDRLFGSGSAAAQQREGGWSGEFTRRPIRSAAGLGEAPRTEVWGLVMTRLSRTRREGPATRRYQGRRTSECNFCEEIEC